MPVETRLVDEAKCIVLPPVATHSCTANWLQTFIITRQCVVESGMCCDPSSSFRRRSVDSSLPNTSSAHCKISRNFFVYKVSGRAERSSHDIVSRYVGQNYFIPLTLKCRKFYSKPGCRMRCIQIWLIISFVFCLWRWHCLVCGTILSVLKTKYRTHRQWHSKDA